MAKQDEKNGSESRGDSEKRGGATSDTVRSIRSKVATAVWLLAVLAAVVLAVGALLVALDFNEKNSVVEFIRETADSINFLGKLKDFSGKDALTKEVLLSWGVCAIVYLVAGKLLERVIRP